MRHMMSQHNSHRQSQIVNCQLSIVDARAFTLIELLVVISVIAVLMAVLMPALSRARQQARAIVCRSHLKQWGTTLALYIEDYDGYIPYDSGLLPGLSLLRGLQITSEDANPNALKRTHAVLTEGIAYCPAASRTAGDTDYGYGCLDDEGEYSLKVNGGGAFYAWEIVIPAPVFRGSYALNRSLFNPVSFGVAGTTSSLDTLLAGGRLRRNGVNVFSLRHSQNIPALLDAAVPTCLMLETTPPPETEPAEVGGDIFINRHNGIVNGLFLDWSVRPVGLKELWTLKWNLKFNTANKWTLAGGVQPEDWPEWMRSFKDY